MRMQYTQSIYINIFIAYSRKDKNSLQELRSHLTPLERSGKVKVWYDGNIEAGRDWEAAIKEGLYNADIILLLVSANSISSDYFYGKEVGLSLDRHEREEVRVVPLILQPCLWTETPLGRLQALPKDGIPVEEWPSRSKAWHDTVAALNRMVEEIKHRKLTEIEKANVLALAEVERRRVEEAVRIKNETERLAKIEAEKEAKAKRRQYEAEYKRRLTLFNNALILADKAKAEQNWLDAHQKYAEALEHWMPKFPKSDLALRAEIEHCRKEEDFNSAVKLAERHHDAGDKRNALKYIKKALKLRPEAEHALVLKRAIDAKSNAKYQQLIRIRPLYAAASLGVMLLLFWGIYSQINGPSIPTENEPVAIQSDTQLITSELVPKGVSNSLKQPDTSEMDAKKYQDPFINELVSIQADTFVQGCLTDRDGRCQQDEFPAHIVQVKNFKITKYETTQAQWRAVMGTNPSFFQYCDKCPVENVNWIEVKEFIKRLNKLTGKKYRLPSEAEWEFAARGGPESKHYTYAGDNDVEKVAWCEENSEFRTHPVGQKAPNELGLFDMSGNVWEWCNDWYNSNYYSLKEFYNPLGPAPSRSRVIRGGAYEGYVRGCRNAYRGGFRPNEKNPTIGFRLAMD